MSHRPAARVLDMTDELEVYIEPEEDAAENSFAVGYPDRGPIYLVTYECTICHSTMQTVGCGHGEYFCSNCQAVHGRKIKMATRFELLGEA